MEETNVYRAPAADVSNPDDEVGTVRFFSPSCRIGRLRMLSHNMLASIVWYLLLVVIIFLIGDFGALGGGLVGVVGLSYVLFLVMFWIIMIQRLHDLDQSGWFSLLMLVPLVNVLFGLYLTFVPGTATTNSYGPKPPANKWYHWIGSVIVPVMTMGVLAAVAIPAYQDYVERAQAVYQD